MAQTLGIMLDCSRNGVMKPEKVKEFAKLIADMGYNMLQLYTEDTYEISGEPFFGHMRGRYSQEELKDIDAYCSSIGVELVPCIQVLAHLNQLTQWTAYAPLFDCRDILMVGEEKIYELIDKMFQTLKECFTTRRVNVGMDEAIFLGRGKYQDKHGYRDRVAILSEHLVRVKEIADRHGFSIMMWSDMFVRLHNNGEYYGDNITIPQETVDSVPEGVELIYWDYYSKEKSHYDQMLVTHEAFHNPIAYAGGIWTWTGFAPNLRYTLEEIEAAMRSVQEHPVEDIIYTLWGDGGKECSYYATLPALFTAAEMSRGNFDKDDIAKKFEEKYGYTFDEFMNLELPNITKEEESHYHDPCKYLLYNDLFLGLYDFTVAADLPQRYAEAAKTLLKSVNGREYDYLFEMTGKLLSALSKKCDLGIRIRKAYRAGDKELMRVLAEKEIPAVKDAVEAFAASFRKLWLRENKPFGLEVQENRMGGLLYRMESCRERILAYLAGEIDKIDELEEDSIAKFEGFEGKGIVYNEYASIVTACVN